MITANKNIQQFDQFVRRTLHWPASPKDFPRICGEKYHFHLSSKYFEVEPSNLRPTPKGIEKLRRYWGTTANFWTLSQDISCSWPLYHYYENLKKIGQPIVAQELKHMVDIMASRLRRQNIPQDLQDDYCRKFLKNVSGHAFIDAYALGPGFLLFCHLHFLTGKAPYTDEQIHDDIVEWLGAHMDDGRKKQLATNFKTDTFYSNLMVKWKQSEPEGPMTFQDFSNDFMRWGTSGGAHKTTYMGETYRTKWAWALANATKESGDIKEQFNLYEESMKLPQRATIALKEEPSKTREIIATPLSSYIRQCYLLYRRGKCPISSPLSSTRTIVELEISAPKYYVSIDGERFDHSVPFDEVLEFINQLGELDEHCRHVADLEIEHLRNLVCTWKNRSYKFEGGLLSGWRITAILGSIISARAAEYIIGKTNRKDIEYIVQGDDIILTSKVAPIDKSCIVRLYNQFGLKANLDKTISGETGEFLKLIHSKNGTIGYPALGFRSLYYANPWITNYQMTNESEMAGLWMMMLSRMAPHCLELEKYKEYIIRSATNQIWNFNKSLKKTDIYNWMRTPRYLDGGGYSETAGPERNYTSLLLDYRSYTTAPHEILPSILGVHRLKKELKPNHVRVHPINMQELYEIANTSSKVFKNNILPSYRPGINITKLLFDIAFGRVIGYGVRKYLTGIVPKGIKLMSPIQLINWLMISNDPKRVTPPVSLSHTMIIGSYPTKVFKYLMTSLINHKTTYSLTKISHAANIYYEQFLKKIFTPYGTI